MNIFSDKYKFFNNWTYICITALTLIVLLDYISTLHLIILHRGYETNQLIAPYILNPFISILFKFVEIVTFTLSIKCVYDIIQKYTQDNIENYQYYKYNNYIIYILFSVPCGITLYLSIHNWMLTL